MIVSELNDIYSSQSSTARYKLSLAGYSGVGKTKLLIRYKTKSYIDDKGTVTMIDHIPIKKTISNTQYIFDYYDTAGQQRYLSIVKSYLRNTHACILVYDLTSQITLDKLDTFIDILDEATPDAIKIIIGNKADMQQKTNDQYLNKYTAKGIKCYKASAKTGLNVQQIFNDLETVVIQKCRPFDPLMQSDILTPHPLSKSAKKGGCC